VAAISNGARELTRGPAGSTRGADWQLRAHLHQRIELQARRGLCGRGALRLSWWW
jgi:hypothetical protein